MHDGERGLPPRSVWLIGCGYYFLCITTVLPKTQNHLSRPGDERGLLGGPEREAATDGTDREMLA